MKKIVFIIAFTAFLLQGCYVGFRHPDVKDHKWGEVSHMDDCAQCHKNWQPEPVLPDGAADDGWWDFYARSAWWQENAADDFFGSSPIPPTVGRPGTRSSNSPMIQPPVTTSSGSSGSLGKSNTKNEDASIDRKRSSGSRRSTTQNEGRSGRSRSSRRSSGGDENE